jgi:hypothetical protein
MVERAIRYGRRQHGRPARRPSRLTLIRIGRNEALARRSGRDREPQHSSETLSFRCECEGEGCRETLTLPLSDYALIRAQAGWIVAPGHRIADTRVQARLEGCVVLQRET